LPWMMRRWPNSECSAASMTTSPPRSRPTSKRIRGLLTQIHPALERALGPHLDHLAVADLLTRYPTPAALKTAGRRHIKAD
jgi:hypothetical protein